MSEDSRKFTADYLASLATPETRKILNDENNELGPALIASIDSLPDLIEIHELSPEVSRTLNSDTALPPNLREGAVDFVPDLARQIVSEETKSRVMNLLLGNTKTESARYKGVEIGAGGMGKVYVAFDTRTQRVVAIKVATSELNSARTRQEALAITALHDSHIPEIYDFAEVDGKLAIVMEYLSPSTSTFMNTLLQRADKDPLGYLPDAPTELPARRKLISENIRGIGDGLAYLHEHGQGHLDVKPSNIALTKNGPKIVDYGMVSSVLESFPMAKGYVAGTPEYISAIRSRDPNYYNSERGIVQSDLFSLAVVLWQYLTFSDLFVQYQLHRETSFSMLPENFDLLKEYPVLSEALQALGVPEDRWPKVARIFARAFFVDTTEPYNKISDFTNLLAAALE